MHGFYNFQLEACGSSVEDFKNVLLNKGNDKYTENEENLVICDESEDNRYFEVMLN